MLLAGGDVVHAHRVGLVPWVWATPVRRVSSVDSGGLTLLACACAFDGFLL